MPVSKERIDQLIDENGGEVPDKPGTRGPAHLRSKRGHAYAMMERQVRVAELYARGWGQQEIAHIVGVALKTVHEDLKRVKARWLEAANVAISEQKARLLDRIDWMETEAQEAWEKSKQDAEQEKVTVEKALRKVEVKENIRGRGAEKRGKTKLNEHDLRAGKAVPEYKMEVVRQFIERNTRGQTGNPAFLDRIAWCIEMRLKIFGILDDKRADVQIMNINWDDLNSRIRRVDPVEQRLLAEESRPALGGGE